METFFVEGYGLVWMSWEDAYEFCELRRFKTSLAMSRYRIRKAMEHGRIEAH